MLRTCLYLCLISLLVGCASKKPVRISPKVGYFNPALQDIKDIYALQYNGQAFVAPVFGFDSLQLRPIYPRDTTTVPSSDYKSVLSPQKGTF